MLAIKYYYCYFSGQWTRHIFRGTKMKFLVADRVSSFEIFCLLVYSVEENILSRLRCLTLWGISGKVTSRFLMITELLRLHIAVMDAKNLPRALYQLKSLRNWAGKNLNFVLRVST
jgi:hypothetical protein